MITSAGLLLHRSGPSGPELLLGHMGGPFWARKDERAWSIPKGEHGPEEDPLAAAVREFTEELGFPPPPGPVRDLGSVRQRGGKVVTVFARAGDVGVDSLTPGVFTPGTFEMEWPPRSGRRRTFPEIDRAGWFDLDTARRKLVSGQVEFVDRFVAATTGTPAP